MEHRSLALATARATRDRVFRVHRVVSLIGVAVAAAMFLACPSVLTAIMVLVCVGSVFAPWLGLRLAAYRARRAASR